MEVEVRIDLPNDPTIADMPTLAVLSVLITDEVVEVVRVLVGEIDVGLAMGALISIISREDEEMAALPHSRDAAFIRLTEMGSGTCAIMVTKSLEASRPYRLLRK